MRRNKFDRTQEWRTKFDALICEHSTKSFAWGDHDCANFARKVIGLSSYLSYFPEYDSATDAHALLSSKSLLEFGLDLLGEPIPWSRCILGDIAVAVSTAHESMPHILCVCDGAQFIAPGERGLVRVYESDLLVGWEI